MKTKVIKEVHTPILDGKYFISHDSVMEFVQREENEELFKNVMVHPFQDAPGAWSIKTFVFK